MFRLDLPTESFALLGEVQSLEQAAQGSGAVTIPGGV